MHAGLLRLLVEATWARDLELCCVERGWRVTHGRMGAAPGWRLFRRPLTPHATPDSALRPPLWGTRHIADGERRLRRPPSSSDDDGDAMGDEAGSSAASRRTGRRPDGAAATGRSKPRASLACAHCRQRKSKVSTALPGPSLHAPTADTTDSRQCIFDPARKTCSSCRALQVPCVISRDSDRRR